MTKLLIGSTLLNQFRVENFIAAGGMATIYRVWDLRRGVPLAMKVLHPELASDPAFIARFQREARALEALSHPHIVPFYGIYKAGDLTFLLEQFIDGPSLDEVLRRMAGAPVSLREALTFFKALYTSLGYAHAQGIIHCDVKPGNVLIDQGGRVFLTDFGIARYAEGTSTTSAIGTPIYMAPEQIRGERVRPETDVYSLGVVMFELLTGRRPFRVEGDYPTEAGHSPSDKLRYAHQYHEPPDPREFNPALPEPLARVILQSLAKDPRDRYPNMQAMAEAVFSSVGTRYEALPDRVRLPEELLSGPPSWQDTSGQSDEPPPFPADLWGPGVDENRAPEAGFGPRQPKIPPRLLVALGSALIVLVCLLGGYQIVRALAGARAAGGGAPLIPAASATVDGTAGLPPAPTATPASTNLPATNQPAQPSSTPEPTQAPSPSPSEPGPASDAPPGQFVIVQREAGRDRLFLLDAASGERQALPGPPGADWAWAPQWSPDGRRIAWVTQYDRRPHIVVLDVETQEWSPLEAGEQFERVHSPSWLGDGQRVSFWAAGGGKNWAVIADAAGGAMLDQFELPQYRNLFVWNWTSGQVAYAQQRNQAYEVGISSSPSTVERILQPGAEAYAPAWSRDGQWLAFQGIAGEGSSQIWIAQASGGEPRQLTSGPEGSWSRAPTWSPDGRFIGYVSNQAGSAGGEMGELFIVEVATGQTWQVTSTGGLVYNWRPDWRP